MVHVKRAVTELWSTLDVRIRESSLSNRDNSAPSSRFWRSVFPKIAPDFRTRIRPNAAALSDLELTQVRQTLESMSPVLLTAVDTFDVLRSERNRRKLGGDDDLLFGEATRYALDAHRNGHHPVENARDDLIERVMTRLGADRSRALGTLLADLETAADYEARLDQAFSQIPAPPGRRELRQVQVWILQLISSVTYRARQESAVFCGDEAEAVSAWDKLVAHAKTNSWPDNTQGLQLSSRGQIRPNVRRGTGVEKGPVLDWSIEGRVRSVLKGAGGKDWESSLPAADVMVTNELDAASGILGLRRPETRAAALCGTYLILSANYENDDAQATDAAALGTVHTRFSKLYRSLITSGHTDAAQRLTDAIGSYMKKLWHSLHSLEHRGDADLGLLHLWALVEGASHTVTVDVRREAGRERRPDGARPVRPETAIPEEDVLSFKRNNPIPRLATAVFKSLSEDEYPDESHATFLEYFWAHLQALESFDAAIENESGTLDDSRHRHRQEIVAELETVWKTAFDRLVDRDDQEIIEADRITFLEFHGWLRANSSSAHA